MQLPSKTSFLVAAAVAVGLTAASAGVIHAQTSGGKTDFKASLVAAIAQKFNLNTAEVQKVVNEQHMQMKTEAKANHQQAHKDRLAKAVAQGKLTQEQANKITAKLLELQAKHEAAIETMKNKTPQERHDIMKAEMASLQKWAADNNIPMQYLAFKMNIKSHGHGKAGLGLGLKLFGPNK